MSESVNVTFSNLALLWRPFVFKVEIISLYGLWLQKPGEKRKCLISFTIKFISHNTKTYMKTFFEAMNFQSDELFKKIMCILLTVPFLLPEV